MLYYYNYMRLTKPMIRAFNCIINGENTLKKIAVALHRSIYWTDRVINSLEEEGFITKRKNHTLNGSRFLIVVSNTLHALKLKELFFQYSGISFEEILADSRLLFLTAVSEDWINTDIAVELSGISKFIIERYRSQLRNRGVIEKKKNLYKVNEKAWPLLKEFLIAYKNYGMVDGQIKWKYNQEILFEVNNEKLIQNNATGLYLYKDYRVNVGVVSALCISPKKKLSKEEIFVHSLFEVTDPRTLHFALTFYLKTKLNYKKVMPIAMKYGKYTLFENFISLIKTKDEKVDLINLPRFDRKDFIRIAHMYGVKDV